MLDVSAAALRRAQQRLGDLAAVPTWIEADVTSDWTSPPVEIWHDRAVFHFLTDPVEQDAYIARLKATLQPGGSAVVATFATDGPEKCSGLPVERYSPESLANRLGRQFALVDSRRHLHQTPSGIVQPFQYSRFQLLSTNS